MINFLNPGKYQKYFDLGFDIVLVDIQDEKRLEMIDFDPETGFNILKIRAISMNPKLEGMILEELMVIPDYLKEWCGNYYFDRIVLADLLIRYNIALVHDKIKSYLTDGYMLLQPKKILDNFDIYIKQYNVFKPNFKKVQHFFPEKSILVIGDFIKEAKYFADYFEEYGMDVYRLATDHPGELTIRGYDKCDKIILRDFCVESKVNILANIVSVKMWKILTQIITTRPFDYIFLTQNSLTLDFSNVEIPVYYFAHKGVYPTIPLNCNIRGFFHAFLGAEELFSKCHRHTMQNVKFTKLIPYSWFMPEWERLVKVSQSDSKYSKYTPDINFYSRKIVLGYMGEVPPILPHTVTDQRDYMSVHIRDSKRIVIDYLTRFFDSEFWTDMFPIQVSKTWLQFEDKKPFKEYQQFLTKCMFFLNVSNIFGMISERQYHAMLGGSILVQSWFRTLPDLGYIDGVNCIIFKTPDEIIPKIYELIKDPVRMIEVRNAGLELAVKNEYKTRVFEVLKEINRYD